jgi:hypothetical protein
MAGKIVQKPEVNASIQTDLLNVHACRAITAMALAAMTSMSVN